MSRRDQILETAADLFATRGFHGVSVGEIGKACGISGPALYKHFDSKDAVLAAMLVGISETLLDEGRRRVAQASSPRHALESLVAYHTDFALQHRSLIVVQDRDSQSLPPPPGSGCASSSASTSTSGPASCAGCTAGCTPTAPGRWHTRRSG